MKLHLILCVAVHCIFGHSVDETPFHKRDANKVPIDVKDSYVLFSSTGYDIDSDIKVSANTSEIQNGELVEIMWENPSVGEFDWIAFYTPPSRSVQDYLDYVSVSDTEGWRRGSGNFQETIFNMRADYEIRYIKIDAQNRAAVKATFRISVMENEPMHGHIAVTGRAGEMRVMWGSAKPDKPRVKFSQFGDLSKAKIAEATSTTYTEDDLCGIGAKIPSPHLYQEPGYFHSALLKDIKPDVRYYYTYGTESATSDIASFVGAPDPTTDVTETKFIGYGDMGVQYPLRDPDTPGSQRVIDNVHRDVFGRKADFVLHFGDISYARGKGYMWDQWMTQMTRISERVPYMVGVGNHEYDYLSGGEKDPSGAKWNGFHPIWGNYGDDSNGECGVPTNHRYVTPDNGNQVFWYSFDYGLVHVIVFSSEHDFRPGSEMYKWLVSDLKSVDRKRTPWVVVACHRPMYTSQEQPLEIIVGEHMKEALEELFHTYGVNLHLSGHEHSYESTCTVFKNKCVEPGKGTVYIIVGTSGYELEKALFLPNPWSKFHCSDRYGYQHITANSTHMHVQFITGLEADVSDDIVIPLWVE